MPRKPKTSPPPSAPPPLAFPPVAPAVKPAAKERLDILLVARGLAPSRQRAQALLLAGQVRVNGQPADKAGSRVSEEARIEIIGETLRFASRAGMKLEGALEDFRVIVAGKTCLDTGCSTGGFTDCLLQRGAKRVYAVDVTVGQLAWNLQKDARVMTVERNARFLKLEDIGEQVDLVTVDVSFISVTKLLPALASVARPGADFLILIKPQFELARGDVGKGGIVREAAHHEQAVERVTSAAKKAFETFGVRESRVSGAEGNREFFLHARRRA